MSAMVFRCPVTCLLFCFLAATASRGADITAAPAAPHLIASTPANNAQAVPTNTVVQFRFDLAMKKLTPAELAGAVVWSGIDPTKFNYTWSADAKTLLCSYGGGFPKDTPI